jgi:hypothetical protein
MQRASTIRRANRHRGEIEAVIGGERRILCLTLGALAELETAFAAGDLQALAERFSTGRLKAGDLVRVVGAGLRGGGHPLSDDEVAALPLDGGLAALARIVGDLLLATFGSPEEPGETAAPNP